MCVCGGRRWGEEVTCGNKVLAVLCRARGVKKPSLSHMFSDVYDELPTRLQRQQQQMQGMVAKYPDHYPTASHE